MDTITSKNIGDKVYFMFNNRLVESSIAKIEIFITEEKTSIDYEVKTPSGIRQMTIGAETEEEMIQKLIKGKIKL